MFSLSSLKGAACAALFLGALSASAGILKDPGPKPGPETGSKPQDYTFTFNGNCYDCTGATGTLVLKNYVLGTYFYYFPQKSYVDAVKGDPEEQAQFVSFHYESSVFSPHGDAGGPIDAQFGDFVFLSGSLGGPDASNYFDFYSGGIEFHLSPDQSFCVQSSQASGDAQFDCDQKYDIGTGTFTPSALSATPEPGSLALLGTGVAFVGAVRRRFTR